MGYYHLLRVKDLLVKKSDEIKFITFDKNGFFEKDLGMEPEINSNLLMSPFNDSYTWLTTPITEILEANDGTIHFKTQNSEYILKYIKDEDNTIDI